MVLSRTHRALLTLVRAGLWETSPDDPDALRLDEAEWMAVLEEARAQTVVGLVWRGLAHVEEDALLPGMQVRCLFAIAVDECEAGYEKMLSVAGVLFAALESDGLHPVLLKGLASAELYEHPELRQSGDIDIFLDADEYPRSVRRDSIAEADGGLWYRFDGVKVEHHASLLDVSAPNKKKFIECLARDCGWGMTIGGLRTTAPLVTLLLLDSHAMKHAVGRGVGLRQCCDFARARKVLDYDRTGFLECCTRLGIGRWNSVFESMCDSWLGPVASGTASPLAESLLERVLEGGNFGRKSVGPAPGAFKTFAAFCSNLGFSLRVAPEETFWTVLSLLGGRLGKMIDKKRI